ncbi:PilW family protein [Neptunicella sp. SCSIO 80796]|uniref:PilW family protein n=1 Tax=Neptunicella plasticusilytica TaxID=3117012 RepID=UPI003A4DE4F0
MRNTKGFTLIEMVIVMVILGIVATGVTSFIRFGTQIFVDVSERDELLSSSRFVLERLNRELRMVTPNSVRISLAAGVQCIEFVPTVTSTFYDQLPGFPAASNTITAIYPSNYVAVATEYAVVYPLSPPDIYDPANARIFEIDSVGANSAPTPVNITLKDTVSFAHQSPARRLFIVSQPVSYCVRNGDIFRHSGYGFNTAQSLSIAVLGPGELMAEHVSNNIAVGNTGEQPFELTPPSLVRNAYVNLLLKFDLNDEKVEFSNEIHIPNAP